MSNPDSNRVSDANEGQGAMPTGQLRSPTIDSLADYVPNLLMAAYGAGWCFTIPVAGGNLFVAELIAALCLPFLGWSKTLARYTSLRLVLAGYGLILLGLIVSDLVNGTPFHDLVRGWANPVFAATSLVFVVSVLRRNPHAFLYFLLATFFFKLIFGDAEYTLRYHYVELSASSVLTNGILFKIRVVPFLIPAVILAAFYVYRFGVILSWLLYVSAAIVLIILGARSASLALFAAAGCLLLSRPWFHISGKRMAIMALPILIGGQLLYMAYVNYSLTYNPSGHTSVQLKSVENPYNPLELLVRGRSDWSVADVIIEDSPIFGHGSWARDPDRKYFNLLVKRSGESVDMYTIGDGAALLPTHSFILTAWIWGGLIAFVGALFVLWAILKTVKSTLFHPGAFSVIAAIVLPLLLWDVFFSPIQVMRTTFPPSIGILIVLAGTSGYGRYRRETAAAPAKH